MRWQAKVRRIGWLLITGVALGTVACGDSSTNGRGESADSGGRSDTGSSSGARTGSGVVVENTPRVGDGAASGGTESPGTAEGGLLRVVFLGTSLTAGLGLPPEQAYPAVLQEKADSAGYAVRIVNAGLSGETSAGALRRAGWVLDQPAALVVLEVGANDGLRGVDPDSTYANLVKLVAAVQEEQPSARIALIQMEAPTNLGGSYTARFHAAYTRAARVAGVPLWPFLLEGVAGVAALNQGDGIHPNETGARRVAETVWRSLAPELASLR